MIDYKIYIRSQYTQIRAQANVLKKALLEEQHKSGLIRETLRLRDTSIRRAEQEVDSLGFRNKQLEQRVAALQDDLQRQTNKTAGSKGSKSKPALSTVETSHNLPSVSLIEEELQKRIFENAELISLVSDQKGEALLLTQRIQELEQTATRNASEHYEKEKQLRKDLSALTSKYSSLELRCSENSESILGSDDALSISEQDGSIPNEPHSGGGPSHHTHPKSTTASTKCIRSDERIGELEREVYRLRMQLEFRSICELSDQALEQTAMEMHRASVGPIGAPWTISKREAKVSTTDSSEVIDQCEEVTREKLVFKYFTERLDRMFAETAIANSKANNYIVEVRQIFDLIIHNNLWVILYLQCNSLQTNLELVQADLKQMEHRLSQTQNQLQISEEDLVGLALYGICWF